ncbi:MAG: phosphatase PAP2 family protein, partial [Planctomycetes bacterium]|nr:phosphatase PAP2 family protein [Planctomycetota bacterium]
MELMTLPRPAMFSRFSPWSLWAAGLTLALAMTGLALANLYLPGDIAISSSVQSIDFPGRHLVSEALYRGGLAPFFWLIAAAIAALLFWRGHRLAAGFVVAAAVTRLASVLIKEIVERPRPSSLEVSVSEQAAGFSFPSSHVFATAALLGFLIFLAQELIPNARARIATQATLLSVIALMGVQRVSAGAHWPTDVLAAWVWGAV